MPRVSIAFFLLAALCALVGMFLGVGMAMAHNFTLSPSHAHLNLVGWATLAIMGTFYALVPTQAAKKLAWINFGLSGSGAVLLAGFLALLLTGNLPGGEPTMMIPSLLVITGMLCFIASILGAARARRATA